MLLDETGARVEGARYFAYGMPFGLPRSDLDGDGDVDVFDTGIKNNAFGTSIGDAGYDHRADIDMDGDVDSTDSSIVNGDFGQTLGRGNLSRGPTLTGGIGNRIGYAGYQWGPAASKFHVRHRVKDPVGGRWLRRDPVGYVDGASLYEYAAAQPITSTDPAGQLSTRPVCNPRSKLVDGRETFDASDVVGQGGCAGVQLEGGGGPPPSKCANEPGMQYLEDCLTCCAYNEPWYNSPWGAQCAQHCNDRFGHVPPPPPPPPTSTDCLDPTLSEPDISTCDRSYGSCDCLYRANVPCMCKCMGNDPWSDYVRACLQCMHQVPGKDWGAAHFECWDNATTFYPVPLGKLWGCIITCRAWQTSFCDGACDPPIQ